VRTALLIDHHETVRMRLDKKDRPVKPENDPISATDSPANVSNDETIRAEFAFWEVRELRRVC
jgi:hypothetical protein